MRGAPRRRRVGSNQHGCHRSKAKEWKPKEWSLAFGHVLHGTENLRSEGKFADESPACSDDPFICGEVGR